MDAIDVSHHETIGVGVDVVARNFSETYDGPRRSSTQGLDAMAELAMAMLFCAKSIDRMIDSLREVESTIDGLEVLHDIHFSPQAQISRLLEVQGMLASLGTAVLERYAEDERP